jgi:hypothetical protein
MSNFNDDKFNFPVNELKETAGLYNLNTNSERDIKNFIKLEKKKYLKTDDIKKEIK